MSVGNGTVYGDNTAISFENNSIKDSSFQVGIAGVVAGDHGDTSGGKTGMDLNVLGTTEENTGIVLSVRDGSLTNIGIDSRIFGSIGDGWGSKITNSNAPTGASTQYGEQIDVNGVVDSSSGNKYGVKVTVSNDAKNNYGVWINSDGASTNNYSILTEQGSAVFNDLANAGSDFQVKGGVDSNLLFIDAGTDNVGVGTNGPSKKLHVNGDYQFYHDPNVELSGANDPEGYGDIVYFGDVGSSFQPGDVVYLDTLTNEWAPTDAKTAAQSTNLLAIALGTQVSEGMLIRGYAYKSTWNFTLGTPLYLETTTVGTAGRMTNTAPTAATEIVRIVGYCVDATNERKIYFNPDNIWIEL